jgi:hypothetical protein
MTNIRVLSETVRTFAAAAAELPRLRGGRPVNASTLWRWAVSGLRGVKLESALLGGVRVTSKEALARFFAAVNGVEAPVAPAVKDRERRRQDTIDAELTALGV